MSPCAALGRAGVVIVQVSCRPVEVLGQNQSRKHREGVADVVRVNPEVLNSYITRSTTIASNRGRTRRG